MSDRADKTNMSGVMTLVVLATLSILLTGCGIQASFPGSTPDQVWIAMKAVAQTPDYASAHYTKRWSIISNYVDIDEGTHTIEIDRHLERILRRPRTKSLYEERYWTFTLSLEVTDPPAIVIRNRGLSLPTKFQFEADRLFSDVRVLLEGLLDRSPGEGKHPDDDSGA